MNLTTHVMFGIAIGVVFFGKPELILLVAIGSMIPDLDREYGLLSEESFRRHQVHRALLHNFVFLGIVYLLNPFLGIGAFLHTFLDALTTAKDRGVEWLYPFTRLVKRSVFDSHGERVPRDPKQKIYFYQNEPLALTKKTDVDLKPDAGPLPWRRTYGPGLSGKLLDEGILVGSASLVLLLLLFSVLGFHVFVDLTYRPLRLAFTVPLSIAIVGGFANYVTGEIYRRRQAKSGNTYEAKGIYRVIWVVSAGMLLSAVVAGAAMNPGTVASIAAELPYVGAAIGLLALVSFVMLKRASSKALPDDPGKDPTVV
jgi:hypothetical protein